MEKLKLFLLFLNSAMVFSFHAQTPFEKDVFQIAFRKEVMVQNKVESVTVFGFSDDQPDTTTAFFNEAGEETSGNFFTDRSRNKIHYQQIIRDSLQRTSVAIYPPGYNAKEARFSYTKRSVTDTIIWDDPAVPSSVFTRFYDRRMNLIKEVRDFSYARLTFRYKYNRKNLLKKIYDADGRVQKIVYTFRK